jgi:hypothetical protein
MKPKKEKVKFWLMPIISPCGTYLTYKKMYYYE